MDRPPANERLVQALRECDWVRLAFLFGSRAQGRAREDSDYDLGILVDEQQAKEDRGRTIRKLAARLGREVASQLLDLVILNDAPALLRHRVLRNGVLLMQRSPEERVRFALETIREYQDGQVRREWFTRRRIQRLKAGPTDGGSGDFLEKARRAARLLGKAADLP
jgi:uncharacterized protein